MTDKPNRAPGWRATQACAWALIAAVALFGCGENPRDAGVPNAQAERSPTALAPDATLEQALAHGDQLERVERVAQILAAATPRDLVAIQGAIEAAPLPWGDIEYALFAGWWARFDPAAAMSYCYEEVQMRHPRAMGEVLRVWAATDPQAVIASGWLASLSLDVAGLNPEFVDPAVVGWFESGKPGLGEWIDTLDSAAKTAGLFAFMRMKTLHDGREPALEWALTAPYSPDMQRLLLAQGLNIVARQEPELATKWIDIAAEKGVDVRTFAARIARGWANHDPAAAMDWIVARADVDPGERWRAVQDVARIWLSQDEAALESWLGNQKKEEAWADLVRGQAIVHHVLENRYQVDWPAQIARASRFVNEEQRQKQLLWIAQRWSVVEPEAASAWLKENGALLGDKLQYASQLPAHEREKIAEIMARPPQTKSAS